MILQYFLLLRDQKKIYDQNIINNKTLLVYLWFFINHFFLIKNGSVKLNMSIVFLSCIALK